MKPDALSLRFLAAVLVSLLLHAVMISGAWLRVPEITTEPPPLEARLAKRPSPAPAPPVVKPATRPKPAARRTTPRRLVLPPAVAAATPFALPPEAEPPEAEPPEPAAETAEAPPVEPAREPVAEAPPAASAPEPAPLKNLPKKGRIAYTMYFGADGFTMGETVQSWEVAANSYKLGSVSETTGIVELFRSQRHIYLSQGKLTARGLQPEKFFMSRTRRGRTEAAEARFDWEAGTITLGKVPHQRGAALAADTQDIVSFMYHLALSPPAIGRIRVPITNGSRFETFDLDVLNEERIETPLGMLKALPVKQVPRPGAESVEIWLAVEYRYLPVKIRFFDREGNLMGEQIVNEIRISEE